MEKKIEALITMSEYLKNFEKGIDTICNYIEIEDEIKACEIIAEAAEGLKWIIDVITLTEDLHRGAIKTNNLEGILIEVVDALENEDYILVGDLFNYEIKPNILEIEKNTLMIIDTYNP